MHARTFATKTEATRWSKDVETDVRRGDWIDPRLARTSFGEWAHEYLAAIVHPRSVTRGDYEGWLRVHVLPTFGDWPIAQIEQVDVRRFLAERHAAGLAPKSLQKVRLVLRQVFELARGSGAIKVNPCDGIRLPRAQQRDPIFLTAEEAERLARATRAPYDVLAGLARELGRPLRADDLVFRAPNDGPLRRDLLYKRMIQPAAVAAGPAVREALTLQRQSAERYLQPVQCQQVLSMS